MSLVFRNALMPSEDQQALRLRLGYFMPQLKNKFLRKIVWFIYGLCGSITLITLASSQYYQVCKNNINIFLSFALFLSVFCVVHWLALKISQSIGLRDKKITFLRDRSLYWLSFFLILQFSANSICSTFR